jgi:hypothetical protein
MNKSYGSKLKLNSKVNEKISTYTPSGFMIGCKSFKKDKDQPIAVLWNLN